MKILFFIDGLRAGGKERQLLELVRGLARRGGYVMDIAVMNRDVHYKEVFDLGVEVHYIIRKGKQDVSGFFKIFRLCRVLKPDVIHAWDSLTAMYAAPAARLLGITFINGFIRHAARPRFPSKFWWISQLTILLAHRTVSNSMAGLKAHGLKPSKKYRCIVNGFDPGRVGELEAPERVRERFAVVTPFVVGMVAGFENRKDYDGFLAAAERVLERRDDVTFIAVGDGKNFERIKGAVKTEHKDHITLTGRREDVESIINIFDIGLMINNISGHAEGISNSIMEYMALGKPVIATDSGGSKELVLDGQTGFIIGPGDVDGLVNKIETLLQDVEKSRAMGQAGQARIAEAFGMEKMIETYAELYTSAV